MIFINKLISQIIILSILICILFIPTISANPTLPEIEESEIFFYGNSNFAWPVPGYTRISSYFGKRTAPTTGASTYHKGIDIPAPEGTALIACYDGEITFTGFLGGGGYTITLTTTNNIKISYCHVSPNYIVSVGDQISQGQLIGTVGPKYVYGVSGNIYKDAEGRPTNGATTGCHLHIGFRLSDEYVNPLDYLQ
ncbi:MAG: M23 family metallopeptidase [Clostridia bacterium]|nr:M23 family metallopeptidase [Clostridia bacterium]